jgi:hypothetical protein
MVPTVVLIQSPLPNLGILLGICQQALGYSVSAAIDASQQERSDAERFLSCLAAMQEQTAKPGLVPHLLSHVSFSVLMAADEEDTIEILSIAEMPFISVPTRSRGVQLTVITGPLSRWQDAVKLGSESSCVRNVRLAFNAVKSIFGDAGLDVWKDCAIRPLADGTFLLEDKR